MNDWQKLKLSALFGGVLTTLGIIKDNNLYNLLCC